MPAQNPDQLQHDRIGDAVANLQPLPLRRYQLLIPKYRQVLGQGGLGQRHTLADLSDGHIACSQPAEDHQAMLIRHGPQQRGGQRGLIGEERRIEDRA